MKVTIKDNILMINHEDLPPYKKGGSIVRNSYFWALKSISCYAPRNGDWEYDPEVWIALGRMLFSFSQSGYLGYAETLLEFSENIEIPEQLRAISTYL
jgi:hypothetical protein